jgi:hypothetical protein
MEARALRLYPNNWRTGVLPAPQAAPTCSTGGSTGPVTRADGSNAASMSSARSATVGSWGSCAPSAGRRGLSAYTPRVYLNPDESSGP